MALVGAVAMGDVDVAGRLWVQFEVSDLNLQLLLNNSVQGWFTGQDLEMYIMENVKMFKDF